MIKYIDTNKIEIPEGFFNDLNVPKFFQWLNDLPTVDLVDVVRCKDCAVPHNRWTGCPKLNGLVTPSDFYCAFGERSKEDGSLH